jgi:hypothetical protein
MDLTLVNTAVLVGLVIYLVAVNAIERKRNHAREDDLITRIMSRDVIEYANAAYNLQREPDAPVTSEERVVEMAQEQAYTADRIPVG